MPLTNLLPLCSASSCEFKPSLLLEDPAKIARLMQAARAQTGSMSPRMLECSSMAGSLTPRMAGGQLPRMQAALTIGSSVAGTAGSGSPSFVLSWLGGAGASGQPQRSATAAAPATTAAPQVAPPVKDVVKRSGARDAAPALIAPAAPNKRSPSKAAAAAKVSNMQVQEQDGNLVFSTTSKVRAAELPHTHDAPDSGCQPEVGDHVRLHTHAPMVQSQGNARQRCNLPQPAHTQPKMAAASRLGFSLGEAPNVLKIGGGAGGSNSGAATPAVCAPPPGRISASGNSDLSTSKDLVLSKNA